MIHLEPAFPAGPDSAELLRQVHTDQAHFRQVAEQISALPEPDDLTPRDPLPASLQADNPLVAQAPLSEAPRATQTELNLTPAAETLDGWALVNLPRGLFVSRDGRLVLSLRLANGLPLPAWVRFDARQGQVQVEARHLTRLGQLQLHLLARDANGHEVRVPLRLQAPTDARADSGNGGLSEQLSATGNSGLLARSQALLASLMGR